MPKQNQEHEFSGEGDRAMAKSVPSNATPAMLEWARKSANLTIEAVADAEKLQPETIQKWERGSGTPSLSRLRKLAKRYKRPLMVFYLPAPPTEFAVVKVRDFRVLTAAGRKTGLGRRNPGARRGESTFVSGFDYDRVTRQ
jgi:transcriptional regulator with XRE-family HTH domain